MADNYTGTEWETRTKISTEIMSELDEGIKLATDAAENAKNDADTARESAEAAQELAESSKEAAEAAQTAAEASASDTEEIKKLAEEAQEAANTALSDAEAAKEAVEAAQKALESIPSDIENFETALNEVKEEISELNANLNDADYARSLVQRGFGGLGSVAYTDDIDDLRINGKPSVVWINFSTATGTLPFTSSYGYILTIGGGPPSDTGSVFQICIPYNSSVKPVYRVYANSKWYDWRTFA